MKTKKKAPGDKIRWGFALFLALCLIALGWRVLRPVFWPKLHHETPKQTSTRMFDDNSFPW